MNYWLMKSEPFVYSIGDLKGDKQTIWDGVRNYQARNFLRQMKVGDRAFFYHSNTKPPGIVGLMSIVKNEVVDPTQFESKSKYYDPKSNRDSPRWITVMVEFVEEYSRILALNELKKHFTAEEILVVKKGNRLSVMPVDTSIAEKILQII